MDNIFMPLIAVIGLIIYVWVTNKQKQEEKERIAQQEEEQRRERERQESEHKKMRETAARLIAMTEMLNQAKAVGDDFTVESIQRHIYHGELPTESQGQWSSMYDNLMIVKIAGINYRGNLSAYVGKFKGVLKPEPKNDYDPNAIGIPFADEYFNVSTIDIEGVTKTAQKFNPDGIMTLATDMPMRSIAAACESLGLSGISFETAVKSTDKGEMIKAFEECGVEHPWYFILSACTRLE